MTYLDAFNHLLDDAIVRSLVSGLWGLACGYVLNDLIKLTRDMWSN